MVAAGKKTKEKMRKEREDVKNKNRKEQWKNRAHELSIEVHSLIDNSEDYEFSNKWGFFSSLIKARELISDMSLNSSRMSDEELNSKESEIIENIASLKKSVGNKHFKDYQEYKKRYGSNSWRTRSNLSINEVNTVDSLSKYISGKPGEESARNYLEDFKNNLIHSHFRNYLERDYDAKVIMDIADKRHIGDDNLFIDRLSDITKESNYRKKSVDDWKHDLSRLLLMKNRIENSYSISNQEKKSMISRITRLYNKTYKLSNMSELQNILHLQGKSKYVSMLNRLLDPQMVANPQKIGNLEDWGKLSQYLRKEYGDYSQLDKETLEIVDSISTGNYWTKERFETNKKYLSKKERLKVLLSMKYQGRPINKVTMDESIKDLETISNNTGKPISVLKDYYSEYESGMVEDARKKPKITHEDALAYVRKRAS